MNKYDKDFDYTAPFQQRVKPVLSISRRRRRDTPKPKVKNVPQNVKGWFVRKRFGDGNYYLGLIRSAGRARGRLKSAGDDEDKTIQAQTPKRSHASKRLNLNQQQIRLQLEKNSLLETCPI